MRLAGTVILRLLLRTTGNLLTAHVVPLIGAMRCLLSVEILHAVVQCIEPDGSVCHNHQALFSVCESHPTCIGPVTILLRTNIREIECFDRGLIQSYL